MDTRTEDDILRGASMLFALERLSDMLQLFAGRLLCNSWLIRRNERSFRPYRNLLYVLG